MSSQGTLQGSIFLLLPTAPDERHAVTECKGLFVVVYCPFRPFQAKLKRRGAGQSLYCHGHGANAVIGTLRLQRNCRARSRAVKQPFTGVLQLEVCWQKTLRRAHLSAGYGAVMPRTPIQQGHVSTGSTHRGLAQSAEAARR